VYYTGHTFFENSFLSDVILSDMGSVIKVQTENNKSYLCINEENYNNIAEHDYFEGGYSSGGSFLGLFSAKVAAKAVLDKSQEWVQSGKSLNEQVIFIFI
jgi:hypothetical protein